jgi:hypothetical protein
MEIHLNIPLIGYKVTVYHVIPCKLCDIANYQKGLNVACKSYFTTGETQSFLVKDIIENTLISTTGSHYNLEPVPDKDFYVILSSSKKVVL